MGIKYREDTLNFDEWLTSGIGLLFRVSSSSSCTTMLFPVNISLLKLCSVRSLLYLPKFILGHIKSFKRRVNDNVIKPFANPIFVTGEGFEKGSQAVQAYGYLLLGSSLPTKTLSHTRRVRQRIRNRKLARKT